MKLEYLVKKNNNNIHYTQSDILETWDFKRIKNQYYT